MHKLIIVSTMTALCLLFLLTGCKKLVNTEQKTVEVTITDEYYRGSYVTPMRVGKITTMQVHPAVYKIYVTYNGTEYSVSGSDTYYNYKDKIGKTVNGTLEIYTYDDGTVKCDIINLK